MRQLYKQYVVWKKLILRVSQGTMLKMSSNQRILSKIIKYLLQALCKALSVPNGTIFVVEEEN